MLGEEAEKTKPLRGSSFGSSSDISEVRRVCEKVLVVVGAGAGGLVVGAAGVEIEDDLCGAGCEP